MQPHLPGTITNTVNALLNGTIKNSTTATTGVVTNSSLGVTKSDSPDPVTAGQLLTYAMSITNNGPSLARNVSFTDNLPTALTSGVQYSLDNINWSSYTSGQDIPLGNLNVGSTVLFWVRGIVNAATYQAL